MQFTVVMKTIKGSAEQAQKLQSLVPTESKHVWELQKKDIVRTISLIKGDGPAPDGAIINMEASSKDAVINEMEKFPFIQEGIATYEVFEHMPFISYERLFAK